MNKYSISLVILIICGIISGLYGSDWFFWIIILFPIILILRLISGSKAKNETYMVFFYGIIFLFVITTSLVEAGELSLGRIISSFYIFLALILLYKIAIPKKYAIIYFILGIIGSLFMVSAIDTYVNQKITENNKKIQDQATLVATQRASVLKEKEEETRKKVRSENMAAIIKAKNAHTEIPVFSGNYIKGHTYGTAPISDSGVVLLSRLQREYQFDTGALLKIEMIQIHPTTIEIRSENITIDRYIGGTPKSTIDAFTDKGSITLYQTSRNNEKKKFTLEDFQRTSIILPGSSLREMEMNFATLLGLEYK